MQIVALTAGILCSFKANVVSTCWPNPNPFSGSVLPQKKDIILRKSQLRLPQWKLRLDVSVFPSLSDRVWKVAVPRWPKREEKKQGDWFIIIASIQIKKYYKFQEAQGGWLTILQQVSVRPRNTSRFQGISQCGFRSDPLSLIDGQTNSAEKAYHEINKKISHSEKKTTLWNYWFWNPSFL